ncbi:MAG: FAD-dependent oxidoreductase [Desulfobacterales bacterium]|nr:FAD-dependent oxidoreductase [Desulfobacterales bacterium]
MILFQPFNIGGMELKNRYVMAPMSLNLCKNGYVTDEMIRFFEERAKGGVGLIVIGDGIVDVPIGNNVKESLAIDEDKYIDGLKKLTDAVHAHGCKIAMQLSHGGRRAGRVSRQGYLDVTRGQIPVAPSPLAHPVTGQVVPRELTKAEIHEIVEAFAQASMRSVEAGFDSIGLHCAHMYLCGEFLSPWANIRNDEYGKDFEGRLKFVLEIISGIKNYLGSKIPLMVRINGEEPEGGNSLDDIRGIASRMEAEGVDALHVSVGFGAPTKTEGLIPSVTPMRSESGVILHLAENVKKAVSIPVIAVNKLGDINVAERALKEKRADMIALGRPLIADPYLPQKAKNGNYDDIRPCIYCSQGCIGNVLEKDAAVVCSINPWAGRENENLEKVSRSKKILVLGGGPSGLKAALTASERGHAVFIVDKAAELGGQLKIAGIPPGKSDIKPYWKYLVQSVRKSGIHVVLNQELTEGWLEKHKPDVAIIATGSSQKTLNLPGADLNHVMRATDILKEKEVAGNRIVVLGGGQIGCEVAEYLSHMGKRVTIVEVQNDVALGLNKINRLSLLMSLERLGVKIMAKTQAESITENGLWVDYFGDKFLIEADTLVVAIGSEPNVEKIENLIGKYVPEVYHIGDCKSPGGILEAVRDGFQVGACV